MQINELNVYSVDGSAPGKSPPIWTPAAGCLLLSRADNPKTKNLVNSLFTRLLLHSDLLFRFCPASLIGPWRCVGDFI